MGTLETPLDAEFIVAIHDPDDSTPWLVQIRWDGAVWEDANTNCIISDPNAQNPEDWECKIKVPLQALNPVHIVWKHVSMRMEIGLNRRRITTPFLSRHLMLRKIQSFRRRPQFRFRSNFDMGCLVYRRRGCSCLNRAVHDCHIVKGRYGKNAGVNKSEFCRGTEDELDELEMEFVDFD